jgi:hypothetical protein
VNSYTGTPHTSSFSPSGRGVALTFVSPVPPTREDEDVGGREEVNGCDPPLPVPAPPELRRWAEAEAEDRREGGRGGGTSSASSSSSVGRGRGTAALDKGPGNDRRAEEEDELVGVADEGGLGGEEVKVEAGRVLMAVAEEKEEEDEAEVVVDVAGGAPPAVERLRGDDLTGAAVVVDWRGG